jgi:hypothetical protein
MITTLGNLVDGQVIEVSANRIVILKDDKRFQIEIGNPIVKEIKKQQ